MPASPTSPPELKAVIGDDGAPRVELFGTWTLDTVPQRAEALAAELAPYGGNADTRWDLRGIEAMDHAGAALVWRAWGRQRVKNIRFNTPQRLLFEHLAAAPKWAPAPRRFDPAAPLLAVGRGTLSALDHFLGLVALLGRVVLDLATVARNPGAIPWREISASVYRAGAQALPITALVGFLVGVVLSYLSSKQLRLFGADIYIVNILGISIVREMGPVLAAILVAGRSGSAMTAQLGVMRVTEELDALSVLGIPHGLRLVLPKVLALTLALPLVSLWTSAVALAGGMVAAYWQMELAIGYFVDSLPRAVPIANLWLGTGKSAVFGALIALTACHFGLRIRPNTESLGRGTTASVVAAITLVIIADAVFAVIYSDVGIR